MKLFIVSILSLFSLNAFSAVPTSIYTDLNCKVTKQGNDPIDYFYSKCESYAGYDLRHNGGDSRDWLSFKIHGKSFDLRATVGYFPYVFAKKIEWRGNAQSSGELSAYAVIYRVRGQDPEQVDKEVESLVVAHLSKKEACVIGTIDTRTTPNANEAARVLADQNADTKCAAESN